MFKILFKWTVALLAVAGLSVMSAYLAFEASPQPMIIAGEDIIRYVPVYIDRDVEVPVEVEHEYQKFFYAAVYADGIKRIHQKHGYDLKDVLYVVMLDYDHDEDNPYTTIEVPLKMPNGKWRPIELTVGQAKNLRLTVKIIKPDSKEENF